LEIRSAQTGDPAIKGEFKVRDFLRKNGSPHWTISATG
jgi:hypothetical protein